jgi:hypothetical protein
MVTVCCKFDIFGSAVNAAVNAKTENRSISHVLRCGWQSGRPRSAETYTSRASRGRARQQDTVHPCSPLTKAPPTFFNSVTPATVCAVVFFFCKTTLFAALYEVKNGIQYGNMITASARSVHVDIRYAGSGCPFPPVEPRAHFHALERGRLCPNA